MNKYTFHIREVSEADVIIEASSQNEAWSKIEEELQNGNVAYDAPEININMTGVNEL